MLKYIISIALFINSIFVINAQQKTDAQSVINNFLNSVRNETIQADFKLDLKQKNDVNSQSVSGNIVLKSNQFYLKMNEIQVWFNGKTQWTLMKENNEVTIIEPTEQELAEINPIAILSGFKSKSNMRFSKTKSDQLYIVELFPKQKNLDFLKAEVKIDKKNNQLISMKLIQKNGSSSAIYMSNYKTGVKTTPNTFQFDKNRFPKVSVNDLR